MGVTGALSERDAALVRVSAALAAAGAAADHPALGLALAVALDKADPGEVEEVILQGYLFLGYPAALNAFRLWRTVSGLESQDAEAPDWGGWSTRGEDVCLQVYGGQYRFLRRNVRALHSDMEQWMVSEGYGKVLGRPGLELVTRELCIAALLAVARAPAQLYSHLRGALNCGASPDAVEGALALAAEIASPEAVESARRTWQHVQARGPSRPGDA